MIALPIDLLYAAIPLAWAVWFFVAIRGAVKS